MKYEANKGQRSYQCGGTLVSFDVVITGKINLSDKLFMKQKLRLAYYLFLTAAHCFAEKMESFPTQFDDYRVILGAHNIAVTTGENQIVLKIANVTPHPDWKNSSRGNFAGDIAIVKLSEETTRMLTNSVNNHIRPACLPFGDEDEETFQKLYKTKFGSVVGWGVYGDGLKTSDVPRKIDIPLLSTIDCVNKFPVLSSSIWDESFCSGNNLSSVCKGDSGSGYLVEVEGRHYLRGVVSSGLVGEHGTCKKDSMTTFADVMKYHTFIKEVSKLRKSPFK